MDHIKRIELSEEASAAIDEARGTNEAFDLLMAADNGIPLGEAVAKVEEVAARLRKALMERQNED